MTTMSEAGSGKQPSKWRAWLHLSLLFLLYLVQGLPFGFQTKTLPVFLRTHGLSLASISFLGALSFPWLIKLAWAPLVDHLYLPWLGRRRSWLIPTQAVLLLVTLALAAVSDNVPLVLVGVFCMNAAASAQDVAVDGLAIDLLAEDDLGLGNAAQVVGFKVGMLAGGGVLTYVSELLGLAWTGVFLGMAVMVALALLAVIVFREPPVPATDSDQPQHAEDATRTPSLMQRMRRTVSGLFSAVAAEGSRPLLYMLLTYKSGEVMADVMFKPFLVDIGIDASDIGLWTGVYAMAFSISGSLLGGWITKYVQLNHALLVTSIIRVLPQLGRFLLASSVTASEIGAHLDVEESERPSDLSVISVICFEALIGGALTTVVFAVMMAQVDKSIGATHYTALTAIEIIGKVSTSFLSGAIADVVGYTPLFLLATLLSGLSVALVFNFVRSTSTESTGARQKDK